MAARPDPVARLAALRAAAGADAARERRALLAALARRRTMPARRLVDLHETLLFLAAYPASAAERRAVEAVLAGFAARIAPHARVAGRAFSDLDERGIAGTSIYAAFSLPVVRWLAGCFPGAVALYGSGDEVAGKLEPVLADLLPPAEAETVFDGYLGAREWLEATRARGEEPLPQVLRLVEALGVPEAAAGAGRRGARALWTALDLAVEWRLDGSAGGGSRTRTRTPSSSGARPSAAPPAAVPPSPPAGVDLRARLPQLRFRRLRGGLARAWIDAGRAAVTARMREVHTFTHASPDDVAVVDAGDGLTIAFYGVVPEERHALRVFYGYLLARNGVPIGYGDALLLFDWGELNFHVFDTFRRGSAPIYAAVVAAFRARFRLAYLFLNRYQFGHHNPDAIRSGAFWFYEKLGFRPGAPELTRLWRQEREQLGRDPAHRSSPAVLERFATAHMGLALAAERTAAARLEKLYRRFHPMHLGLAASRRAEALHGGERRRAAAAAGARVRAALGGDWRGAELQALERMAPILDLVPDLERWSAAERQALAAALRLKPGRQERDHLLALQRHRRLRDALVALGSRTR